MLRNLIEHENDRLHPNKMIEFVMKDREEFDENCLDVEWNSFDKFDICQITVKQSSNEN